MGWTPKLFTPTLVVLGLILIAHAAMPARSSGDPAAPTGLTTQGRLLWNLEGLLTKTFGHQPTLCVSAKQKPKTFWNFTARTCAPLSKYFLYWYTFQSPHGTTLHISSARAGSLFFGNYPVPVLIRGRMVACDAHDRHFLIDYASGAGLMLGCLTPQPFAPPPK